MIKQRLAWVVVLVLAVACTKTSPELLPIPKHFPPLVYTFTGNPLSEEGVALGKRLFYDPVLSSDSSVACGSCHHQPFAFSDRGRALSTGVGGRTGKRNAPGIFNVLWHPHFMADGGVNHLEVMPLAPITDTLEMNERVAHVNQKLQRSHHYPEQFKRVFGSDSITTRHVMLALAQFMGTLVSANSRYDRMLQRQETFTPVEEKGYRLFKAQCAGCHAGVLQTDFSFRNNGLDKEFSDMGRARVTAQQEDEGKFRVPSLRNVALTAPYMHDGRFHTLEEVLQHYRTGIQHSHTLDKKLPGAIRLNDAEASAVISFLHTLTDSAFICEPAFRP
jgi:cytochrome c peroxidase